MNFSTIFRSFSFFLRPSSAPPNKTELIRRVAAYRGEGSARDGIHVLSGYKIDKLDYALMGADNSCAEINNPAVGRHDIADGKWFAAKDKEWRKEDCPSLNFHSSGKSSAEMYVDSFYLAIPKRQYQASPEEVVWHYERVNELRASGTPQPDRVRIMTNERISKPWIK